MTTINPRFVGLVIAYLVLVALLVSVHARQFQFVGQQDQNALWQDETVWSPTGVPNTTVDDAMVSLPQAHVLTITQQVQIHNLTLAGAGGTLQGNNRTALLTENLMLESGRIVGMPITTGSLNTSQCHPTPGVLSQDTCIFDSLNTTLTIGSEWVNEGDVLSTMSITAPSITNLGTLLCFGLLNTTTLVNRNTTHLFNGDLGFATIVNYARVTVSVSASVDDESGFSAYIHSLQQYEGSTYFNDSSLITSAQLYGGSLNLTSSQNLVSAMNILGSVKLTLAPSDNDDKNTLSVSNFVLANNGTLQLDTNYDTPILLLWKASLLGVIDVSLVSRPDHPWLTDIPLMYIQTPSRFDYNATLKGNEIMVEGTAVGQYFANITEVSYYPTLVLQPDVEYSLNVTSGGGHNPTFNMSLTFAQLTSHAASKVQIQLQLAQNYEQVFLAAFQSSVITDENGLASTTLHIFPELAPPTFTVRAFVSGCYTRGEEGLCSNVVDVVFNNAQQDHVLSTAAIVGIVFAVIGAAIVVVVAALLFHRRRARYQTITY